MAAEVGIVETRAFIKHLKDSFGWDFGDYSITFLKRRLEHLLTKQSLRDTEALTRKLNTSPTYLDQFLEEFIPSTSEMFRDPSLWRYLKDKVLLDITENGTKPVKIFLAAWDSGEELYSLMILLHELNLQYKTKVFASELSPCIVNKVKEGLLDEKKMELNSANYERFAGKTSLNAYFKIHQDSKIRFSTELIKDVVFVKQNTNFDSFVVGCKLVLFRNQLIYMNINHEERVIGNLRSNLMPSGYLAVGIKENLEHLSAGGNFQQVNSTEKVYKLKLG